MIAIVDYGMGNVASVRTAFRKLGYQVEITDSVERLEAATHIILPGVGSFRAAVEEISKRNLAEELRRLAKEKPFLGICLGMQLLFEKGYENGISNGLAVIPGEVEIIKTSSILPHIGWNQLQTTGQNEMFEPIDDEHVYFVHSYQAKTAKEYIVATTEYNTTIPAIVQNGQVYGMQFHPEKSGDTGIKLLRMFMEQTS